MTILGCWIYLAITVLVFVVVLVSTIYDDTERLTRPLTGEDVAACVGAGMLGMLLWPVLLPYFITEVVVVVTGEIGAFCVNKIVGWRKG